jgi:hypothetical protein
MILDRRSGGCGRGCDRRRRSKEALRNPLLCQATAQRDEKCAHVFEHFVPRLRKFLHGTPAALPQRGGVPTRVLCASVAFSGL